MDGWWGGVSVLRFGSPHLTTMHPFTAFYFIFFF
jgi:hypothetical protein